jgi:phage terminase small subunit
MLTQKKELAIQYHLDGANQTEAVQRAYDCKNYQSAGALASKLFKQEEVKKRLEEKQAMVDIRTIDNIISFQNQVQHAIPSNYVITKLKELFESKDKRVIDSAIDKYIKIIGGYKEKDSKLVGLFGSISADK